MPDLDEITAGEQPLASEWRENNESSQDCLGPDKPRVRLYTAIPRARRPGHGRPGRLRRHRHLARSPAGRAGQPRPPPRGRSRSPSREPARPPAPSSSGHWPRPTASPPGPLSPVQPAHQLTREAENTLVRPRMAAAVLGRGPPSWPDTSQPRNVKARQLHRGSTPGEVKAVRQSPARQASVTIRQRISRCRCPRSHWAGVVRPGCCTSLLYGAGPMPRMSRVPLNRDILAWSSYSW